MSKHTPGPWVAEDATVYTAGRGSRREVAECQLSSATAIHETDEANARLIAAAPELLQYLKFLSALVDNAPFELTQEQSNTLWLAQQAIAKAEGK